jgi:hypothetical protein
MKDIATILLCGILGALLPSLLQIFLGPEFLAPDEKPYVHAEMERNRLVYLKFIRVGEFLSFISLLIYISPKFIHSPYPFGVMFGVFGFAHIAAAGYTFVAYGLPALISYITYAASRWKAPSLIYLTIIGSLGFVGIYSASSVVFVLGLFL